MSAQKITIEPVTRIEGHAKVTIHLNEAGDVERAYLHINEFRGFEKFCEGRMYFEMPIAKQSLIDDVTVIGSGNLDYRSFLHNHEVMVQCTDPELAKSLILQWGIDVNEAREIHLPEWRRRSLWEKITEKLCYAFRYYL